MTESLHIIGYYDRSNLGDETYKIAMRNLFPSFTDIRFVNIDHVETRFNEVFAGPVIIGGGDLINEYFAPTLMKIVQRLRREGKRYPIIGLSLGISYEDYLSNDCLRLFDSLILRSPTDVRPLQKLLGSTIPHYLPDVAFSLTTPVVQHKPRTRPIIGFFLAPCKNPRIKRDLAIIIHALLDRADVTLYRFDSSMHPGNDDSFFNNDVVKALQDLPVGGSVLALPVGSSRGTLKVKNRPYDTGKMLKKMSQLNLAICMRYHAHIFASISGTPLVSIGITRKVKLLIEDSKLQDFSSAAILDNRGAPTALAVYDIVNKAKIALATAQTQSARVRAIAKQNAFLLSTLQVEKLLYLRPRYPECFPCREKVADIVSNIRQHITRRTNAVQLKPGVLNRESAAAIAGIMSLQVTGAVDSEYVYGTIQNLLTKPQEFPNMLEWMANDFRQKSNDEYRLNLEYIQQDTYAGLHRSGWHFAIEHLRCLSNAQGVLCDTFLDRTFNWAEGALLEQGLLPYTSPWVGFIHHTPLVSYSEYNTTAMFMKKSFRQSLPMCKGLFVLTEYLAEWVRMKLHEMGASHVHVCVVAHPTEFPPKLFNPERFLDGNKRRLINVGAWLRDPFAIHRITLSKRLHMNKYSLRGNRMDNYFCPDEFSLNLVDDGLPTGGGARALPTGGPCRADDNKFITGLLVYLIEEGFPLATLKYDKKQPLGKRVTVTLRSETRHGHVKTTHAKATDIATTIEDAIESVTVIPTLSNDQYDDLLTDSVVFLKLLDCSAVNTIIECIARNTPLVVNRMKPTVEILGAGYPLFYDSLSDVKKLVTLDNITAAHEYLRGMNKEKYRIESFVRGVKESLIYAAL